MRSVKHATIVNCSLTSPATCKPKLEMNTVEAVRKTSNQLQAIMCQGFHAADMIALRARTTVITKVPALWGAKGSKTSTALRSKSQTAKGSAPGRKRPNRKEQPRMNLKSELLSLLGTCKTSQKLKARKAKGSRNPKELMRTIVRCCESPQNTDG